MRETIWLEEGDSVSVARYKLEQAQSKRIALVVPPRSPLLRSEVDLIVLRRSAEALAVDLVLVTSNRASAGRARLAGLRTVATVSGALRVRGQRSRGMFSGPSRAASALAPAVFRRPEAVGRRQLRPPGRRLQQLLVLTAGCAVTLLLLAGLALLVPSATVVLDPKGSQATAEAQMLASTDVEQIDAERGWVPARLVEIEAVGEEEGQTTGKQSLPDQHATGEVVFANKTMEPITVTKGTVVRTNDGEPVKFYTLLDVGVPGSYGATARAAIMAFEPGSEGNVEALTIRVVEGDAGYQVDVLNDKPTRGGSEKRIGIVAREDYDRLRAQLMQRLQQEAYGLVVKQLDEGEWVPPDTLEVAIAGEVFDKKLDEPSEMLRLTMKVRLSGVAVQGQATREIMARTLEARGKGLVVNDVTLQVEQPVGTVAVEGQVVRFKARASALLVPAIDLRTVSAQIAGQDRQGALRWLSGEDGLDLRRPPEVRIQPHWWPRLPWLPSRISVQLSGVD